MEIEPQIDEKPLEFYDLGHAVYDSDSEVLSDSQEVTNSSLQRLFQIGKCSERVKLQSPGVIEGLTNSNYKNMLVKRKKAPQTIQIIVDPEISNFYYRPKKILKKSYNFPMQKRNGTSTTSKNHLYDYIKRQDSKRKYQEKIFSLYDFAKKEKRKNVQKEDLSRFFETL